MQLEGRAGMALIEVKTDTYIYVATERVRPLGDHVQRGALGTETIKWGLWNIAVGGALAHVRAGADVRRDRLH